LLSIKKRNVMAGSLERIPLPSGETLDAYVARPAGGNGVGMLLLSEIFNVNDWVRSKADRYAAQGYAVVAPDLYWRLEPGRYFGYTQREDAFAIGSRLNVEQAAADAAGAGASLKQAFAVSKVVALGFCLGGRLAALASRHDAIDAAVSYYGVHLEQHVPALKQLRKPMLMHFGQEDAWTPPDVIETVREALNNHPRCEIFIYPGVGHAFDRDGYAPFDAQASSLAGRRTQDFIARL
jgi:carboxymethylenebutenolidase